MRTNSHSLKIVFFAGAGRSGSTLLGQLLGEVPGFVNIGEGLAYAFDRRIRERGILCGCGESVESCPFWSRVVAACPGLFTGSGGALLRLRSLPLLMLPGRPSWLNGRLAQLGFQARDLLAAVAQRTGCEVVVDSSKNPALLYVLSTISDLEVFVVHLVRDPRGFVSSRSRPKAYLRRIPLGKAALVWTARNVAAEISKGRAERHWRIRYEDFVREPQVVIESIVEGVVGKRDVTSFVEQHRARVSTQHILAGNPDKLQPGLVSIEHRDWNLSRWADTLVKVATYPLMRRYGYSDRSVGAGGSSTVV